MDGSQGRQIVGIHEVRGLHARVSQLRPQHFAKGIAG